MMRQMCWLSSSFSKTEYKILHLRTAPHEAWQPYTAFPQYAVPDYRIPGGSKGWATYQKLRQAGWVLIPSATVSEAASSELMATEEKELTSNQLPQNV